MDIFATFADVSSSNSLDITRTSRAGGDFVFENGPDGRKKGLVDVVHHLVQKTTLIDQYSEVCLLTTISLPLP